MRITHLWRYPVKSLAGEPLASTDVDRGGIPFDRRYVILDGDTKRKGQPLTARQIAGLLAYEAAVNDGQVRVTAPDGSVFDVGGALESHLQGALLRPVSISAARSTQENFHDAHDVLVINAASVRSLALEWGAPVNPLRFRPNIMIDGDDAIEYAENAWAGRSFTAGNAVLDGVELDTRCVITTIDPVSLHIDPSFLRLIVEHHNQCFGLYCDVREPGRIAVGDEWQVCT